MKKLVCVVLSVAVALGALTACSHSAVSDASQQGEREFTDDAGRTVRIPEEITSVAVTGPLAQMVVFALAPDELVGIADEWDASAEKYFDEKYYHLPVLGQLYGGKGEMNMEELLNANPQVVIDIGEGKDSIAEDLNSLTSQTGIPFVHIDAYLASMNETYEKLGDLLGMQEQANELANYCANVYRTTTEIADSVEKANILYITGEQGHNVIAKGSYHAEAIDLLTNNLAVVDEPSSKGTGNEVDMEQILAWNPDKIIFAPDSAYQTVGDDPVWQQLDAIQSGNYYQTPGEPYNWMGFPPSVQRLLGMLWLTSTLYPEAAHYDLYEQTAQYFKLFYHCDLTREAFEQLVNGDAV